MTTMGGEQASGHFQIQILMSIFSPSFLKHNLLDLFHCVSRMFPSKVVVSSSFSQPRQHPRMTPPIISTDSLTIG